MPSQFTVRRWVRNKAPLIESRPAGWSLARFPRTEEGRKGSRRWSDGRVRASAPTRLSKVRGAPPRHREGMRTTRAPREPTDRARKGRLTRDARSILANFISPAAAARTHVYVWHTYVRDMECVRRNSRSASASHPAFYQARVRLERETLVKSHRSRSAYADAAVALISLFFLSSVFFSYESGKSLVRGGRRMRVRDKLKDFGDAQFFFLLEMIGSLRFIKFLLESIFFVSEDLNAFT